MVVKDGDCSGRLGFEVIMMALELLAQWGTETGSTANSDAESS